MSIQHPLLGEDHDSTQATVQTSESSSIGTFSLAPNPSSQIKRSLGPPFTANKKPNHKSSFYSTAPMDRLPSPTASVKSAVTEEKLMPPPAPPKARFFGRLSKSSLTSRLGGLSLRSDAKEVPHFEMLNGSSAHGTPPASQDTPSAARANMYRGHTHNNSYSSNISHKRSGNLNGVPTNNMPNRTLVSQRSSGNMSAISSVSRGSAQTQETRRSPYGVSNGSFSTSRSSFSSDVSVFTMDTQYTGLSSAPFWKYHVLKLGKDLYLTTNPGLEHVYCRNGPGYFVELEYNDKREKPRLSHGFTLTFKDINCVDSQEALMTVIKKPMSEGGHLTVSLPVSHQTSPPQRPGNFNGLLIPKKIPLEYLPDPNRSTINYEFKDFNNCKWNVGPIPRVRKRRSTRLHRLNHAARSSELKYVGKNNVYFHQNYLDIQDCHNAQNTMYRWPGSPEMVYQHDSSEFPPVLGMFRPYENSKRKRIMSALKKRTRRESRLRPDQVENDIGAGSVKGYFKGGDGLYFNGDHDDTPDDNKLGWITVYEDERLFGEQKKGLFEMVLGLTLAAGLERNEQT